MRLPSVKSLKHWPLWLQLILSLVTALFLVNMVTAPLTRNMISDFEFQAFSEQSKRSYALLAATAIDAVITEDIPLLSTIAEQSLQHAPNMVGLYIKNEQAQLLVQQFRDVDVTPRFIRTYDYPISYEGEQFGSITILWNTQEIETKINHHADKVQQVISVILMVLTSLFLLLINWLTIQPIHRIIQYLEKLSNEAELPDLIHSSSVASREMLLLSHSANDLRMFMKNQDVRERRLKENIKSARDNQAKNNAILASSLDSIITIDDQSKVIDYNQAAQNTFGWSHNEIIGQSIVNILLPEEYRKAHRDGMKKFLETGEGPALDHRLELVALHKDGHSFPIEISISQIESSDRILFSAFIRDISSQKEHELNLQQAKHDAEAASRAKSGFLAAMSHEIRTPMNAVLGILGLLRDTNLNDEQKHLVKTGRNSSELLLSIINDILDFSKMEADKLQLENSCFDLHYLITDTTDLLSPLAHNKSLIINVIIHPDLPRYSEGDPERLRQILINLINNAIKFTQQGIITVSASANQNNNQQFELQCAIQDTGIGISEDNISILFEEFTMADQSHSRAYEGTGLGLAICKRLVNLMHGDISVNSELGKGSTFTFNIPLNIGEEQDCHYQHRADQQLNLPKSQSRILLAEDNPANQMVIKSILEYADQKVDIVANGLEALVAISTRPYDIVLMDISMPEMDGMESTKMIRQLSGDKGKIPIIALTAHALSGDKERFLAAGMDDYLTKPIQRASMLHCIAHWTGKGSDVENIQPESTAEQAEHYVNEGILQQLVLDTDAEIVPELLLAYIDDAKVRIEHIQQAVTDHDEKVLEFETHTLGSSAIAHGNDALHDHARKIEHLCREGDTEQAFELTESLFDLANNSFNLLTQRAEQGFK